MSSSTDEVNDGNGSMMQEESHPDNAPPPASNARAADSSNSDGSWEMVQPQTDEENTNAVGINTDHVNVGISAPVPENDVTMDGAATEVIGSEVMNDIRNMLWSSDAPDDDRARWYRQGFVFCDNPVFGLQQGGGGGGGLYSYKYICELAV
jgi:hypothetical protein